MDVFYPITIVLACATDWSTPLAGDASVAFAAAAIATARARHTVLRTGLADELIDARSHDPVGALRAAIDRWDAPRRGCDELRPALARLDALERRLRRSRAERYAVDDGRPRRPTIAALAGRLDARREARSEMRGLARELRSAASRLDLAHGPGGTRSAEAAALRIAAEGLGGRGPRGRSSRRSRRLEQLIERALRRGDPAVAEPASFEAHLLRDVRLPRQDARTLDALLVRCVSEARRHGRGSLQTIVGREAGRAVFRMVNFPAACPVGGRGRGRFEFERLARALPGGSADFRGLASGEVLGFNAGVEVFLAQFSFDLETVG